MPMGLWTQMMLCLKGTGRVLQYSFTCDSIPQIFGDWPFGTHRGHVGVQTRCCPAVCTSQECGEYGDPWSPATSSQRLRFLVHLNGMEQVGEQLVDFKGRAELVKDYITEGKSSCENHKISGSQTMECTSAF